MAEQQQDVETLKRRGRRRLVGAVALVLLAVIVLPMVFDPEPRPSAPPVSARIPGEDETPFKPKAKAPEKKEFPAAEKKVEAKVEKKELASGEFVVPVGAFASPEGVIAKLAAAKIPYFTEPLKGLTRVRAGPFATREAAEKALEKLRGMGMQPGAVTTKAG
jgi:DedD protein